MSIVVEKFDEFEVYMEESELQFRHININQDNFYNSLCDYLLDYKKLNTYTSVNLSIEKELTNEDYRNIFSRLSLFVDNEKIINISDILDPEIIKYLDEELIKDGSDLRRDKWGRIGEYIFNILLDSYFKLDCVLRKFSLNTSPNVSVFGIDTVHCSLEDKKIYFGESKFCNDIKNGVSLINKSLEKYELSIINEYLNVTNPNFTRSEKFNQLLNKNLAFTFKEFIEMAGITTIGIPIFIAHAGNYSESDIFDELRKIKKCKCLNLKTEFIAISFPILDKNKFREYFIEKVNNKLKELKDAQSN